LGGEGENVAGTSPCTGRSPGSGTKATRFKQNADTVKQKKKGKGRPQHQIVTRRKTQVIKAGKNMGRGIFAVSKQGHKTPRGPGRKEKGGSGQVRIFFFFLGGRGGERQHL